VLEKREAGERETSIERGDADERSARGKARRERRGEK
jgi:hypothetical protein